MQKKTKEFNKRFILLAYYKYSGVVRKKYVIYRGFDHVYLRLATFQEIPLSSSSGKVD